MKWSPLGAIFHIYGVARVKIGAYEIYDNIKKVCISVNVYTLTRVQCTISHMIFGPVEIYIIDITEF